MQEDDSFQMEIKEMGDLEMSKIDRDSPTFQCVLKCTAVRPLSTFRQNIRNSNQREKYIYSAAFMGISEDNGSNPEILVKGFGSPAEKLSRKLQPGNIYYISYISPNGKSPLDRATNQYDRVVSDEYVITFGDEKQPLSILPIPSHFVDHRDRLISNLFPLDILSNSHMKGGLAQIADLSLQTDSKLDFVGYYLKSHSPKSSSDPDAKSRVPGSLTLSDLTSDLTINLLYYPPAYIPTENLEKGDIVIVLRGQVKTHNNEMTLVYSPSYFTRLIVVKMSEGSTENNQEEEDDEEQGQEQEREQEQEQGRDIHVECERWLIPCQYIRPYVDLPHLSFIEQNYPILRLWLTSKIFRLRKEKLRTLQNQTQVIGKKQKGKKAANMPVRSREEEMRALLLECQEEERALPGYSSSFDIENDVRRFEALMSEQFEYSSSVVTRQFRLEDFFIPGDVRYMTIGQLKRIYFLACKYMPLDRFNKLLRTEFLLYGSFSRIPIPKEDSHRTFYSTNCGAEEQWIQQRMKTIESFVNEGHEVPEPLHSKPDPCRGRSYQQPDGSWLCELCERKTKKPTYNYNVCAIFKDGTGSMKVKIQGKVAHGIFNDMSVQELDDVLKNAVKENVSIPTKLRTLTSSRLNIPCFIVVQMYENFFDLANYPDPTQTTVTNESTITKTIPMENETNDEGDDNDDEDDGNVDVTQSKIIEEKPQNANQPQPDKIKKDQAVPLRPFLAYRVNHIQSAVNNPVQDKIFSEKLEILEENKKRIYTKYRQSIAIC